MFEASIVPIVCARGSQWHKDCLRRSVSDPIEEKGVNDVPCYASAHRVRAIVLLQLVSFHQAQSRGPLAYISNEREGTVTVIDTAIDQVVSTIQVGGRPRGIQLGTGGSKIFVALTIPSHMKNGQSDSVVAIDSKSGSVMAKHDVGSDPEQFAVSRDGSRLYDSNEDAGTASIIDLKTGRIIATLVVGARRRYDKPEWSLGLCDGRKQQHDRRDRYADQ